MSVFSGIRFCRAQESEPQPWWKQFHLLFRSFFDYIIESHILHILHMKSRMFLAANRPRSSQWGLWGHFFRYNKSLSVIHMIPINSTYMRPLVIYLIPYVSKSRPNPRIVRTNIYMKTISFPWLEGWPSLAGLAVRHRELTQLWPQHNPAYGVRLELVVAVTAAANRVRSCDHHHHLLNFSMPFFLIQCTMCFCLHRLDLAPKFRFCVFCVCWHCGFDGGSEIKSDFHSRINDGARIDFESYAYHNMYEHQEFLIEYRLEFSVVRIAAGSIAGEMKMVILMISDFAYERH